MAKTLEGIGIDLHTAEINDLNQQLKNLRDRQAECNADGTRVTESNTNESSTTTVDAKVKGEASLTERSATAEIGAGHTNNSGSSSRELTETNVSGSGNCTPAQMTSRDVLINNKEQELDRAQVEHNEYMRNARSLDQVQSQGYEPNTSGGRSYEGLDDDFTIFRSDPQGNLDPNGPCITRKQDVNMWVDPDPKTYCDGKMEPIEELSQNDTVDLNEEYRFALNEAYGDSTDNGVDSDLSGPKVEV